MHIQKTLANGVKAKVKLEDHLVGALAVKFGLQPGSKLATDKAFAWLRSIIEHCPRDFETPEEVNAWVQKQAVTITTIPVIPRGPSTANKIFETSDYDKFELYKANRDIRDNKLLERSMRNYGWLDAYPMLVTRRADGKLIIKSGHHRFVMAVKLNIPIKYVISDKDVPLYELEGASNAWNIQDYMTSKARSGAPDYMEVQQFCADTGIHPGMALHLLAGGTVQTGYQGIKFKDGSYRVAENRDHANAVAHMVKALHGLGIDFAHRTTMVNCLSRVLRVDEFDPERFLKKVKANPDLLTVQGKLYKCMAMLEEVYNFRTRDKDKIPLAFLVDQKVSSLSCARSRKRK